jgi:hypothetical protein
MGLFSGIKNRWYMSESAVVVQNLLEMGNQNAFTSIADPAKTANWLIQCAWDVNPDAFSGIHGRRPHKMSLAAASLANAIDGLGHNHVDAPAYAIALGHIFEYVRKNGALCGFAEVDEKMIGIAASIYTEYSQTVMNSPLGKELSALGVGSYPR